MTRPSLAILLLLGSFMASAPAWADVIPPSTISCFDGARVAVSHSGQRCAPARCQDDSRCKGGKRCQLRRLCVLERSVRYRNGSSGTIEVAVSPCPDGKTCARGKCKELKVCAKKLEAKKPEVKKPEVKKPEVKKPAVKKPEVKKPEVKKPEVKKPEVKKPVATSSEAVGSTSKGKGGKKSSCAIAGDLGARQHWPLALLLLAAALRGRYRRAG